MAERQHPRALALRAAPLALVGAAFASAVAMGWRRWGDLLTDTGRELELPRRLLGGERLYADLRYYYGPLAPYVNAVLYRIFGVHADVVMWAGIASAAVMTWLVWLLARRLTGRAIATLVAASFVYLCAFPRIDASPAIFNFALPYTFAATYGMVVATASLLLLLRYVEAERTGDLALSVAFLVLAGLAKLEVLVPVTAAHGAFLAARFAARAPGRRPLVAYAAGAVALALVYGVLLARVGPALWTENLAGVANTAAVLFIRRVMGVDDLGASLTALGLSAAAFGGVAAIACLAGRLASRPVAMWTAVAVATVAVFGVFARWGHELAFTALPWLVAGGGAFAAWRWWRTREQGDLAFALAAAFAVAALARVILRPYPSHYGFYLLPVALACGARLLFRSLPAVAARVGTPAAVPRVLGAALVLGTVTCCAVRSAGEYSSPTIEIATPRGRMLVPRDYAILARAIADLGRRPPGTRVVVVPQGAAVPFLAGLEGGDSMFSYLPMEIPDTAADHRLAERWRRQPADLVLIADVAALEFGFRGFGRDYALEASALLREYYVLERAFALNVGLLSLRPLPAAVSDTATSGPDAR